MFVQLNIKPKFLILSISRITGLLVLYSKTVAPQDRQSFVVCGREQSFLYLAVF